MIDILYTNILVYIVLERQPNHKETTTTNQGIAGAVVSNEVQRTYHKGNHMREDTHTTE